MIFGSDVETTVLDKIATSMPSSSPDIASSTSRCDIARAGAGAGESRQGCVERWTRESLSECGCGAG